MWLSKGWWVHLCIVPNCDKQMFYKWHIVLKCIYLNFIIPCMTSLSPAQAALPLLPPSSTCRARRWKNLQGLYQLMWFLLHVRLVRFNEGVCPEHIVLYMVHLVGLPFWHRVQWEVIMKSKIPKEWWWWFMYLSVCAFLFSITEEAI